MLGCYERSWWRNGFLSLWLDISIKWFVQWRNRGNDTAYRWFIMLYALIILYIKCHIGILLCDLTMVIALIISKHCASDMWKKRVSSIAYYLSYFVFLFLDILVSITNYYGKQILPFCVNNESKLYPFVQANIEVISCTHSRRRER